MSEKKERGEGGYHATGTHPTNASRAKAKWRENAGLSPSTFMDAKPNKFIPHAVRSAKLRKQGYTPSEARRIASYQSSTAGLAQTAQNTGEAGELPDARVNPPMYQPPQGGRRSGGARNADMLVDQPSEAEPPPTGTPAAADEAKPEVGSDEAKPEVGSDEWRKGLSFGTPEQNAQANFSKALKDGTITPAKVKQAEAFAASKGWNFDANKGYSMPKKSGNSTTGGTGDPEGTDGTASFKMPDGSITEFNASQSPKKVVKDARKNSRAEGEAINTQVPEEMQERVKAMHETAKRPKVEDMIEVKDGKLTWSPPSNSRASGESPGKQASRASGPAEQTQGFEKQDLEMLPDTVAGRARGAKAGNSYRSENGDVWRNDGDGGYNVEKAGGESPLSGKQRNDFDAYKAGLDAEYKERFPRGHDKDGPVKKTTKQPEPTVDITNIDTILVDKPNEPPVPTGKELQKEPTNMERVLAMDAGKPFKGGGSDRIQDLLDMDAGRNRPSNRKPSKELKEKLKGDSDFSKELSKIARKGTDGPNYIKAMTALAKQHGFDFDPVKGIIY